jgi:hypothetical protein
MADLLIDGWCLVQTYPQPAGVTGWPSQEAPCCYYELELFDYNLHVRRTLWAWPSGSPWLWGGGNLLGTRWPTRACRQPEPRPSARSFRRPEGSLQRWIYPQLRGSVVALAWPHVKEAGRVVRQDGAGLQQKEACYLHRGQVLGFG